ncbi:hypothetical protein PVK06_007609 [Gossypium arboreum]|uniref:RNase H type-1 domain-containing protein n=1 Tax=Gossypium arboreum TaxID=29729 RepID=A0ABR0QIM0_GOSAR|nr:hypothetical protein PVK06_007609 [Gossypium arboreum]
MISLLTCEFYWFPILEGLERATKKAKNKSLDGPEPEDVVEDGFPNVSWRDKLVGNVEERGLEDEMVVKLELEIREDTYTISTEGEYPKITFSKWIHEWIDRSMAKTVVSRDFITSEHYHSKMVVWVRFPRLPYRYYTKDARSIGPNQLLVEGIGHELLPTNVTVSTIKHNAVRECPSYWTEKHFRISLIPYEIFGTTKITPFLDVMSKIAIFIDKALNSEWAELDALLEGIRLAQSLSLGKVIFEMDCACIVNHLCKYKNDITIFGYCIKEVREMFDSFSKAKVR